MFNLFNPYRTATQKPANNSPSVQAVKFDAGKQDWSLLPVSSIEEVLKVLAYGKEKYGAWNWTNGDGMSYSRLFNATLRHVFAWWRGEDLDKESGLSHLAHAACNVLFLLYFMNNKATYNNNDDRSV